MNDYQKLVNMVDISAVRTDVTLLELEQLASVGKKAGVAAVVTMPCFTPELVRLMGENSDVMLAGVAGFPSGADTTTTKVLTTREMIGLGCKEIDMVINVGALKSRLNAVVKDDIAAVVSAAEGLPVKAILETNYLSEEEIRRGTAICVEAGVAYVKTGTGWTNHVATPDVIRMISEVVDGKAQVKAAGGIRTLTDMRELHAAGATRFGISLSSFINILEEIEHTTEQALL